MLKRALFFFKRFNFFNLAFLQLVQNLILTCQSLAGVFYNSPFNVKLFLYDTQRQTRSAGKISHVHSHVSAAEQHEVVL